MGHRMSRRFWAESKVAVKSFSCRTGYTKKVELEGLGLYGSDEAHTLRACVIRAVSFNENDTGNTFHGYTITGCEQRQLCFDSVRGLLRIDWQFLKASHFDVVFFPDDQS